MQNHRNEDGSYTWYITDEKGRSVPVTLPAGTYADGLEGIDNHSRDSDIRWDHLIDTAFELSKANAEKQGLPDPMTLLQSPEKSVEERVTGGDVTEKKEVIEVRKAVATLKPKFVEIYDKRYERYFTQVEIAKKEGKGKSTISMGEKKMQELVKEKLGEAGIDEAYFDKKHRK